MAPSIWSDSLATHKQRLREHIVGTAGELLAERGLGGVSMSLLAQRAGIARATLYNHFPDFERVLAALVADEVARFRVQLDRHLADASDPVERLRRYLVAVHDWATNLRRHPKSALRGPPAGPASPGSRRRSSPSRMSRSASFTRSWRGSSPTPSPATPSIPMSIPGCTPTSSSNSCSTRARQPLPPRILPALNATSSFVSCFAG